MTSYKDTHNSWGSLIYSFAEYIWLLMIITEEIFSLSIPETFFKKSADFQLLKVLEFNLVKLCHLTDKMKLKA